MEIGTESLAPRQQLDIYTWSGTLRHIRRVADRRAPNKRCSSWQLSLIEIERIRECADASMCVHIIMIITPEALSLFLILHHDVCLKICWLGNHRRSSLFFLFYYLYVPRPDGWNSIRYSWQHLTQRIESKDLPRLCYRLIKGWPSMLFYILYITHTHTSKPLCIWAER